MIHCVQVSEICIISNETNSYIYIYVNEAYNILYCYMLLHVVTCYYIHVKCLYSVLQ